MANYTTDSLTPKQRAIYDAMPIGEWVSPNGSVSMSAMARMGLLEQTHVYVGKHYGTALECRYRRNA